MKLTPALTASKYPQALSTGDLGQFPARSTFSFCFVLFSCTMNDVVPIDSYRVNGQCSELCALVTRVYVEARAKFTLQLCETLS